LETKALYPFEIFELFIKRYRLALEMKHDMGIDEEFILACVSDEECDRVFTEVALTVGVDDSWAELDGEDDP
jgi:sugar diacid utilization regulator